jgi:hypothetical protein
VEANNIVNEALDLIEWHVRTVLDQGGEAALRARLERLLAKPNATSGDRPIEGSRP